ncbi:tRNA threonylcarbamoyl adenosine modification protein YgjD [Selenomonas sp. FOBRC6]|uniref:tRNA (adenosine(37)-N6)-threonylcarbamoyltransferase complex transferase subunit TsaD n=1 Tax=Selenomonas sp. FOBRC6 TaxID=936572 RepID=UPI0002782873|nr:tRNA (adenosine(37)-N6)-threonylcarbamoyltransferase complex transferase subunit TsaD [Selenomonas sp. FOBRC6]EJO23132.1 tRNA threonylcarbamoyl adenosine modification protein YgjD [Selenomonas sp. FOBRC6]
MKDVQQKLTLGIETSCDETSAAILRGTRELLSCVIATQIPIHQKYGGVVPEIASRNHILSILPVVEQALDEAGTALSEIDQVAVTYGPGLVGALLVGVSAAKSLAFSLDVPLIGVNHLEGHIFANFLAHAELTPPFMALVVSGGHTALVDVADYETFRLMGRTRDDAAGEAFDKVARVMGLPYPGGPEIDRLAREGNPAAIDFPRALAQEGNYEFSFSGLKSAVLNYINSEKMKGHALNKADIAASFQSTVVEVLVHKAFEAIREAGRDMLVLAGGVAANKSLERRLRETAEAEGIRYLYPPPRLCTDNAAMIACRGVYAAAASKYSDLYLNAVPGLDFA